MLTVIPNKLYLTRDGYVVRVRENTEGWLDKLPFVCEPPFGRKWSLYTVDHRGWVWPFNNEPDLFGKRDEHYSDLVAEVTINQENSLL